MKILFILLFLLLALPFLGYSQKQLVLIKQNKIIGRINEGEYLRFKRKDRDHFTKGYIEGIQQNYFRMGDDTTYLYDVAAVDMKGRATSGFKVRQSGVTLMVAGAVLLIIDAMNNETITEGVVVVGSSLAAAGLLMQFVNDDIFKIGRKKKIITMGK